jgi:Na+/H+-dicarboxylate symporter/ABC-type amino acid transport substrate-binding protein
MVVLAPLAFPSRETASFFSRAMVEEPPPVNFFELYIPANPFYSLANTLVPAAVVFAIALGVALMAVPAKERVIGPLDALAAALMRVTQFVAGLAPYGVFAIVASTAGTLSIQDFGRMQVYVLTQALVAVFLVLWVLPALVSALTPIRYGEIFRKTRDALVTAFATGNLLIVLPILSERSKDMLLASGRGDEALANSADILVPASFNFPSMGKLLSLLFVPFAAWFVGQSFTLPQYPGYLATGFASFFGNVIMAMPFLLNLQQIPSDLLQLFLAGDVIGGRFGTLLAAMHTVVFALLGAYAMQGKLRVHWGRLLRMSTITVMLLVALLGGARLAFSTLLKEDYTKDEALAQMQTLMRPQDAIVHREPAPLPPMGDPSASRVERIRARDTLRVGYVPETVPYVFWNSKGDLVGFDVEMANALAREIGVTASFVPVEFEDFPRRLEEGYCDLVMSGLAVTTELGLEVQFSESYLRATISFLTRDHRRRDFVDAGGLDKLGPLRLGIGDVPYYRDKVQEAMPQAELVSVRSATDTHRVLAAAQSDLDAIVMPAEEAAVWSVMYPGFGVAIPKPDPLRIPVAYAMAPGDEELADLVNMWIELKRNDGTIDRLYRYWIEGRALEKTAPRWSVIRNLLKWVD